MHFKSAVIRKRKRITAMAKSLLLYLSAWPFSSYSSYGSAEEAADTAAVSAIAHVYMQAMCLIAAPAPVPAGAPVHVPAPAVAGLGVQQSIFISLPYPWKNFKKRFKLIGNSILQKPPSVQNVLFDWTQGGLHALYYLHMPK
jgi:hypothetical protein